MRTGVPATAFGTGLAAQAPGSAAAPAVAFASAQGNATMARALAGGPTLARNGTTGAVGVAAGDGILKISPEVTSPPLLKGKLGQYAKYEGKLGVGGEVTIKWKKGAKDPTSGSKVGGGKGEAGGEISTEVISLWKADASGEAVEQAKESWTDHLEPVEAILVFGAEGAQKGGDTSMAASVGLKIKLKSGNEANVKVVLAEWKKNGGGGAEGPSIKLDYAAKAIELKETQIFQKGHPATVSGKIDLKPEVMIQPDYAAIAARLAIQALARVGAAAAPVALPIIAAAAMLAYGAYVAEGNAQAARQGAEAGVAGRKKLNAEAKGYAGTLLKGEGGGGGVGPKTGAEHYKQIEEAGGKEAALTKEEVTAKIREVKGDEGKVAKENRNRLREAIFAEACKKYDAKNDREFWARDDSWGNRGVFRQHLRMVLFSDTMD